MELPEYFGAVRRHWLLILALVVFGGLAGFGVAKSTIPTYVSTSSVFVSVNSGDSTIELVQGSNFAQASMQSYAELATMPVVLDPVIQKLGLDKSTTSLARDIATDTPLNTVVLNIKATAESAQGAADLANAVTAELSKQIQQMAPKDKVGEPVVDVRQTAVAIPPKFQNAPNTKLLAATGAAAGLLFAVCYALLRSVIDTRLRNEHDLGRLSQKPVLGLIPRLPGKKNHDSGVVMRRDPHAATSEAYRRVAANLEFLSPDDPVRSVAVTSSLPAEGKSQLVLNLAVALAESKKRVLVIDADLRRPTVAKTCGIDGQFGLTTVLTGGAELQEAIVPWGPIHVLPAGRTAPNPAELLSSKAMGEIMAESLTQFDFIIVDAAPLLPVSDTLSLVRHVSGTVMVAQAGRTKARHLRSALSIIDGVKSEVYGIVLNRVKTAGQVDPYQFADPNSAKSATLMDTPPDLDAWGPSKIEQFDDASIQR